MYWLVAESDLKMFKYNFLEAVSATIPIPLGNVGYPTAVGRVEVVLLYTELQDLVMQNVNQSMNKCSSPKLYATLHLLLD